MHPSSKFQVVRETLMREWDPLDVAGALGAEDEYDDYIWDLQQLLDGGAGVDPIFNYLRTIETRQMGVQGNPGRTRHCAELLAVSRGQPPA